MSAATGFDLEDTPSPGDITLCLKCGAVMTFADDLTVRGLTEQEVDGLCANTEFMTFLARKVRQIHIMQAEKN